MFAEEYHDLVEDTKVTNGDAGFHLANTMQEIGGGDLSTSLLAAGAERDIVTKLKDAVEKLTKSNASLTTQLSDAMKLNLEMDKKLNLKATQGKITKSRYWRRRQIERPHLKGTWNRTATTRHTGS